MDEVQLVVWVYLTTQVGADVEPVEVVAVLVAVLVVVLVAVLVVVLVAVQVAVPVAVLVAVLVAELVAVLVFGRDETDSPATVAHNVHQCNFRQMAILENSVQKPGVKLAQIQVAATAPDSLAHSG